ncbi:MAG: BBP7 family outer membrane beta-barrel protein [Gemmataceae bacterium]
MMNRMLVAFAAALIGVGAALAQAPCAGEAAPAGVGYWASADFLLGRINGPATSTPFLTTATPGTPRLRAGVRDDRSTSVLFGSNPTDQNGANEDPRIGFRLGAGVQLSNELAVEGGFMMLESQTAAYSAASDGDTILARPFTNPQTRREQSLLVAFPEVASGSIDFRLSSSTFLSANLDVTETFWDRGWFRLDSLLGYRFYRYDGAFRAVQVLNPLEANFVPGTRIDTRDDVSAQNEFHGAEVGVRAKFLWDDFALSLLAKVAGGNLRREVKVSGAQTITVPGLAPVTSPAGFYALSSNSGTFLSNDFTAVPEFGATLSWRVSPMLNLRVGYTMTQLGRAASAAQQIDSIINPALLPPAARDPVVGDRPRFVLIKEDIWVQTLNLGAEFTW